MGRLTEWNENKQLLVREEERLLNANGIITKDEMYKIMRHLAEKLVQYEDLEEQGLLLRLPCSRVYYIVDKGTKYATVMSKPIQDLRIFEIKGIDKDGYYWSTQEQAEHKCKGTEDK